jgi:D-alanyl-lipoteichoic acid acyltransferase DltB (MBOAT superfamily)
VTFTSFEYLLLLLGTVSAYYLLPGRPRLLLLLVASYVFYCYEVPAYGLIIASTTLVDYLAAIAIERSPTARARKAFLAASVVFNLGVLGYFKYANFALDALRPLLGRTGVEAPVLQVVLPVGISFYTFQEMAYTIDVYRKRVAATRDPLLFATFVSFFPQLVAGPIERAETLMPQLVATHRFDLDRLGSGVGLIFMGLAKKLVLSDRIWPVAYPMFRDPSRFDGFELSLGLLAMPMALYLDFSGYTDIARGSARLFGIELDRNFIFPWACANPADLWRRWHVMLTRWMRDYLFLSLPTGPFVSLIVTAGAIGLWHGASGKFVLWGVGNGLALAAYLLWRIHGPEPEQRRRQIVLPVLGWVLFAAYTLLLFPLFFGPDVGTALAYWTRLARAPWASLGEPSLTALAVFIALVLAVQVIGRNGIWEAVWKGLPAPLKGLAFAALFYVVLYGAVPSAQRFVYSEF